MLRNHASAPTSKGAVCLPSSNSRYRLRQRSRLHPDRRKTASGLRPWGGLWASINLLAETMDCFACAPFSSCRKERHGSGQGCQPSRRRLFRTAFSLRPIRPAIHRLLIPLALRRRMAWSRSWAFLCLEGLPEGRPSGRASALGPPALRRSW